MSLLGATLAVSWLLAGSPTPVAYQPLAAQIAAERARNISLLPAPPGPPPRHTPRTHVVRKHEEESNLYRLRRLRKAVDIGHPEYPQLLLSLAQHHEEKRTYFLEQRAYLDEEIAVTDPRRQQHLTLLRAKRTRFHRDAAEATDQFIKLLGALVTAPQLSASPLLEEALYIYILELGDAGRLLEMAAAQQQMLIKYPKSSYQPHLDIVAAHRDLARGELTAARTRFNQLLAGPVRELHPSAHLGLGWSYMRSEAGEAPDLDAALAAFIRAIETSLPYKSDRPPSYYMPTPLALVGDQVLRSAHDGLVHAFAGAGRPNRAAALFNRLADLPQPTPRLSITLLERLALAYFARGQHHESAEIYRELQRLHPGDPQVCAWQMRILLTAAADHDRDAALREVMRLADIWQTYRNGNLKQAVKRQCRDDALNSLAELARHWHREADLERSTPACTAHSRIFASEPPLCSDPPAGLTAPSTP